MRDRFYIFMLGCERSLIAAIGPAGSERI